MSSSPEIILYHYHFSPFARRIVWYLTLRGIPYKQVLVSPILPRPELERLGIAYRRIPVLSLGASVYCDTRLILEKLEAAFPDSQLASANSEQEAVRQLLANWAIDGGVFARAAQTIPPELPLLKDPKFQKDREAYSGRAWSAEQQKNLRPEALVHIRQAFDLLENGLLADGRAWILKTEGPSLGDIEAVWLPHWMLDLKTALPKDLFSNERYPKVFAWVKRFDEAFKTAKATAPKTVTLKGDEAAKIITSSPLPSIDAGMDKVDEDDPTGLKAGAQVASWPTDTGTKNRDQGKLLRLNGSECVLENASGIRIHHPRWNYRVQTVKAGEAKM